MKPKKNLGQNFLVDNSVIDKIISTVMATKEDLIIEIGPGQGALTKELAKMSQLIAIEIDKEMAMHLNSIKGVEIIYDDILNIDFQNVLSKYKYNNAYIVANIPYYITTPIIKKIIESKINFKEITLMVQKELADRFASKPGDSEYNSLTVFLNYYFEIERLFFVGKKSFYPSPKVNSEVIKLKSKENKIEVEDYNYFEKLVKESFLHRRKTLRNNLKNYNLEAIDKILLSGDLEDGEISVSSIEGIEVFKSNNPLTEIEVKDWTPGLYFVKIKRGTNCQIIKFVKSY